VGIWKRLFGDEPAQTSAPAKEPEPPKAAPASAPDDATAAETWLTDTARAIAAGAAPPAPANVWPRIEALRAAGRERLALEYLDKLAAVLPDGALRDDARLRAAELRADRGELREALPALEALTTRAPYAARAHFLLAEHQRRQGDLRAALFHLEAVLAVDVEFPNARVRALALRAELGARAAAPAATGETIAGPEAGGLRTARYQLLRQLGRGATGVVYLGRDVELGREVAIKLLHPHLAGAAQSEPVRRFFAEARTAAALRHPNIVAILDLDEPERRLVMEHAAGGTLRARLAAGPLDPLDALVRHAELLSALVAAHARGVVHRDLKPANILFRAAGATGELVLTDFGVAHLAGADRRAAEREPVGTLAYMAPEQRRGGAAAPAADVYAAGVILHECLTGRLPWSPERVFGPRGARDLCLPAVPRAQLGRLADDVDAHLAALGALDPAARPDVPAALAAARRLADARRDAPELDALADELAAFRAGRA
jgi:hypothetical protein